MKPPTAYETAQQAALVAQAIHEATYSQYDCKWPGWYRKYEVVDTPFYYMVQFREGNNGGRPCILKKVLK